MLTLDGKYSIDLGSRGFSHKKYEGEYFLYENRIILTWKVRFFFWTFTRQTIFYREDGNCLTDPDRRELRFRGSYGILRFKFDSQPEFVKEFNEPKKKRKTFHWFQR